MLTMRAVLLLFAAVPMMHAPQTGETPSIKQPGVDRTERLRAISALADLLEQRYVDPAIGARYAAMLRGRLTDGTYGKLDDLAILSQRVTSDLQAVSPDGHLRIGPKEGFHRPRAMPSDAPLSARPSGPPGLEQASMLPGGIAYLRYNQFLDNPSVAETGRAFLLAHRDARALILDCRANRGGGMAVMNAILPLFYDRPTLQMRMDTRTSAEAASPSEPDATLVRQPSPAAIVRYDHVIRPDALHTPLSSIPIYYLISRRTASAAEALALALKRNHRATLIGEATAGANHFGDEVALGAGLLAFIPVGRAYDPATGADWEGVGIRPDIPVPPDHALEVAQALAVRDMAVKRACRCASTPK